MADFDDVGAGFVNLARNRGERAGLILNRDSKPRDAALAHEVAHQDVGEQVRIDVAAAQDRARPSCRGSGPGSASIAARPAAPAPSTTVFSIPQQHRHRALEVALRHEHDVVRIILEDARGELARLLDRDALGERVAAERQVAPWIAHFIDG